ncbi:MAG: ribosomal protein L31 [Microgenomates group bacterium GW2011_GWF2_45_18]|nr:MAG: ribosomal protein L31 [Microgenomates group bacterium GW2011_GWF1_44_10]KKU01813.1 MAG: ribosomal protein L31 [Microgenomates group bacterium GW2011_GWF2_45_18]OGJ41446.1 MAG: 50S ribosomal protein L31 [Candidatus Pacebacteria bacterium RIFOXYB1_FULL_44_10]HAU98883.1 50S ribosomal protein L31 [Candidatus Paceibacterota bacterium]HAX01159.1 50S ribosomal protein L31 [Candidatus Paceibacterota bacterium]
MKTTIHPKWNHTTPVTCSCGNTFQTGSTLDEIRVDVCSACHPFYTGTMKFVDLQGRVDRFITKRKAASGYTASVKNKKKDSKQPKDMQSLKELLAEEKKTAKN